jgi:Icc-related predicted phosphoesterase
MLQIVVFGDIHDHHQRLGATLGLLDAPRYDLALLAGDVGEDPPWDAEGRRIRREAHDRSLRRTVNRVAERVGCPVLFVPGNHDLRDATGDLRGTNIDGRVVEAAGLTVAGFGGAGPTRFGFPYEWTEEQADRMLEDLLGGQAAPDVLLSHAPPANTRLDRTHRGDHVGSPAVRKWIGQARPRLFVCGHIHEAPGMDVVEGVPCLNAGAFGEPYGEEIVWVVRWGDAGPSGVESLRPGAGGTAERVVW